MLIEFILGVVGNLVASSGEKKIREILSSTPIKKAINSTAQQFPESNQIKDALTRWCESDEFFRQAESVRLQQISITEQDEVDSFISIGRFYDGILGTNDKAISVLRVFKTNLELELYRSPDGLYMESVRAYNRHLESQERLRNLEDKFNQLATKNDLKDINHPKIFVTEHRRWSKSQDDLNFRNVHQLKFIKRENRNIEIELNKGKLIEEKNVLEIFFIFSLGYSPYLYDAKLLLKDLLRETTLKSNYGVDWITYDELDSRKWTVHGQILTKEFPQLSYLDWLERDFLSYPATSSYTESGEPAKSSKLCFYLIEPDDEIKVIFEVEDLLDIELINNLTTNANQTEATWLQSINELRCPIHNKGIGLKTIFINRFNRRFVIESCCQSHIDIALGTIRSLKAQ